MKPTREEWRPVHGYEDRYEVSSLGRVRSLDVVVEYSDGRQRRHVGQIRRPQPTRSGHQRVRLCRDGEWEQVFVHRLVLAAFVGPCPPGMEACHGDGDPANNTPENLRWDTRSENERDRVRHGTHHIAARSACPLGHEFTGLNLGRDTRGRRFCKACKKGRRTAKALGVAFDPSMAHEAYEDITRRMTA